MNVNDSPFVRNRTGWLFLTEHAPPAACGVHARAPAVSGLPALAASSIASAPHPRLWDEVVPPGTPSAIAKACTGGCPAPRQRPGLESQDGNSAALQRA